MPRSLVILFIALLAVCSFAAGLVLAFSDSQSVTGTVTATSGGTDLYICEASPSVPGPGCAADDFGPDEMIFEGLEDMVPGKVVSWDVRLKNVGTNAWDVETATPQVSIADDPGGDCSTALGGDGTFGFEAVLESHPSRSISVTQPLSIAVNTFTNRVYVGGADGVLSVIDGATGEVVANVSIGGGNLVAVAVNPVTNRVYVVRYGGSVVVLDGATNSVVTTIWVNYASSVAVNPTNNRIYVGTYNYFSLSVIDGLTNSVVTSLTIGGQSEGLAVNPLTNRIYSSGSSGGSTLTVVDGDTNTVVASLFVGSSPTSMAINPDTSRVYTANYGGQNISVIDTSTNTEIDVDGDPANGLTRLQTGLGPYGIAVDTLSKLVYVANLASGTISVVDGMTNTVSTNVLTGASPSRLAMNPATGRLYALDAAGVSEIDVGGPHDNHNAVASEQLFPRVGSSEQKVIHVEPNDYEDVRLFLKMPDDAPDACADTAWSVVIPWTVASHP